MADNNAKPPPPESKLERIVEILERHAVEFLVIGGQAEILMGSPRVTYDTDLCYRRTEENLKRLAEALTEMHPTLRGAPPDLPFVLDARGLAFGNNYTLETDMGPLDLLGWVERFGGYEALLPNAESYNIGEMTIRTIGLEDLIRIKTAEVTACRKLRRSGASMTSPMACNRLRVFGNGIDHHAHVFQRDHIRVRRGSRRPDRRRLSPPA